LFWFNHLTKTSSWDRPKLLERYGDVETPFPWITTSTVVPKAKVSADENNNTSSQQEPSIESGEDSATKESSEDFETIISYWHVTARRNMDRKPDGVFICSQCNYNISLRFCDKCEQR
jgi:hypothetical protein